jgi:hypothetical protein
MALGNTAVITGNYHTGILPGDYPGGYTLGSWLILKDYFLTVTLPQLLFKFYLNLPSRSTFLFIGP